MESKVEKFYLSRCGSGLFGGGNPYILTANFPELGLFTALRFIEWISQNPEGVISLPTGKTPEHFIRWTQFLLNNWESPKSQKILKKVGLGGLKKPKTRGLRFVQIDEFYPISPKQHNSFCNYVTRFYIENLNLDPERCLLINSDDIPLYHGLSYREVFPDYKIDLSLRNRKPLTEKEFIQKNSIYSVDNWCREYEESIRALGGIGFFLGGIGPDGHIAFNVKGSDHLSTTRLTETNYETQAAAATDLGGIEVSRNRLVITIGLGSITYNPDCVALIFAAGESKAAVIRDALEKPTSILYPATALRKLPNARFYLTRGAACLLSAQIEDYYRSGDWSKEKTYRAISDLCKKKDKYASNLSMEDLQKDPFCRLIPGLNEYTPTEVIEHTNEKIEKGLIKEKNEVYLHTGPHHDDIMLGILPHVSQQLRQKSNEFYFSVLTSGFTSVTNSLIIKLLRDVIEMTHRDQIQMMKYPDFFEKGYRFKFDKDVNHYLNKVAERDEYGKRRGLAHRMVRNMVEIYKLDSTDRVLDKCRELIASISAYYDGEKNSPDIQQLKGMIREFEEELVWAHFGVKSENCMHNRLGFYKGDIFTESPQNLRDVQPVLKMIRDIRPTVISLAFDPEGSGPDTHYKVLQVIAEALRIYSEETDTSHIRIRGYRNVWYRFHPADANLFIPVSLNSLATLENAFMNCYVSQVDASFPSPDLDGPFSRLTEKIWTDQMKEIQLIMGKDYFYEHPHPKIRATHGFVFIREMKVEEFLGHARELAESMEGDYLG